MNVKKQSFLDFPRRNKKAAMELSVTAIVVLILAIVMLGLGLGFIRGMFSKVSSNFDEQISTEPEPPQATGSDPITLSRETMIVNSGSNTVLKIEVYNPSNQDWSKTGAWPCTDFNGTQSLCTSQKTCTWAVSTSTCSGTDTVCGTAPVNTQAVCDTQIGCMWDGTICKNAVGITPSVSCSGIAVTQQMNAKKINQGESASFNDLMTIPKGIAPGTYLCQASVASQYQKDFTIKVTK
ncbi:MAG: hypothetical protein KKC75_05795 [Nanoarchaeota archaeon]|nr:hypothetical protein [Nanoarchaeota archaeon]MBU1004911.1 hypothetical protein [Nanoarchaeota archaeon]MBU1945643.1 hypothetical protein [Nanoarchaeota archaeon]